MTTKLHEHPLAWLAAVAVLATASPALAHVKWFSQSVDLTDVPLTLGEIATPTFYALAGLSVVVVIGLTLADPPLQKLRAYQRLRDALAAREGQAGAVMRIATGMTLLLAWQADVLLAPELSHTSAFVSWLQFLAILCLLDVRSTPVAGLAVWLLYGIGIGQYGLFHMLDYLAFVGVGFYLVFHGIDVERFAFAKRPKDWVKPVLFGTTGLSLVWLALEKLVFPTWGIALLEQHPALSLGLPPKFFLMAAAFIELSLGYLLLLGVLGRPLALIITLVFFSTSLVFGKDEVVGHLILHGVLIVFMLEGTRSRVAPPFRLHRALPLRVAFVAVNFAILLAVSLVSYHALARPRHVAPITHAAMAPDAGHDLPAELAPRLALRAEAVAADTVRLHLDLEGFAISAKGTTEPPAPGQAVTEGHAHLFVNGEMRGMIFALPHDIEGLPPGEHEVMVQLSTPDHRTLTVAGDPIESSVKVKL